MITRKPAIRPASGLGEAEGQSHQFSEHQPVPNRQWFRLHPLAFVGIVGLLFLVWSNSFVAIGYLLGGELAKARFNALGLTLARFLPSTLIAATWLLLWHRAEMVRCFRRRWLRLIACGLLVVPGSNLALYSGQAGGVPAPIASLITALTPFFLMVFGAVILGEKFGIRQIAGFGIALLGISLITMSKGGVSAGASYPFLIALTACGPLCWSFYTILSKQVSREESPLVWTFLSICLGTALTALLSPAATVATVKQLFVLDSVGWGAILFLSLGCTIFGFAAWNFLLEHAPASRLGFTVFLNPPLTTLSKWVLALALPASFTYQFGSGELLGGLTVLGGMAVALYGRRS